MRDAPKTSSFLLKLPNVLINVIMYLGPSSYVRPDRIIELEAGIRPYTLKIRNVRELRPRAKALQEYRIYDQTLGAQ